MSVPAFDPHFTLGSISTKAKKKTWFPSTTHGNRRSDSFSYSFMSRAEPEPSRGTVLNPKLLEMVIKTINKRPSIAGEFQKGLAKTATQTWNTHLTERKRLTKKQKVVEDIATNLGLAKGFKTKFQDEAERLVSILFKEIGKRKPIEEEISSESIDSEVVEEESDQSIPSFIEIPEPVKQPPKPKKKSIKVHSHPFHSPYITTHKKSEMINEEVLGEVIPAKPAAPRKIGLSFINVRKIKITPTLNFKDEDIDQRRPILRTYTEVTRRKTAGHHEHEHEKENENIRKKFPKKGVYVKMLTPASSLIKQSEETLEKKSSNIIGLKVKKKTPLVKKPLPIQPPGMWKFMEIKPLKDKKESKKMLTYSQQSITTAEKPKKEKERFSSREMKSWESRDRICRNIIRITSELDVTSLASSKINQRLADQSRVRCTSTRTSKKKRGESTPLVEFDEKTRTYVVQKIKDVLSMLTYSRKNVEVEFKRQERRERKSIFVLWKNYFDIRRSDDIVRDSVEYKKIKREDLMRGVDLELAKTAIYHKLAKLLGELARRPPYERAQWQSLNKSARQIAEDKERIINRQASKMVAIHEEKVKRSKPSKEVRLEDERRRKVIEDYIASLSQSPDKYGAKRPNTRETTMEEILQMRGFRGPPRNCKNTIWIRKPDFIGYLKPLKRKPKTAYNPYEAKFSKPDYEFEKGAEEAKTEELLSESDSFPFNISIKRPPVVPVPMKKSKPCVEPSQGFYKYFGYLDDREDSMRM